MIVTAQNAVADAQQIVHGLPSMLDQLADELAEVISRMEKLKNAGLIYAVEHWRKDAHGRPTYFYLNYPSHAGEKRRREYIGRDPARIEAAQAGIARASQYDQLAQVQAELEARIDRVTGTIRRARDLMQNPRAGMHYFNEWG